MTLISLCVAGISFTLCAPEIPQKYLDVPTWAYRDDAFEEPPAKKEIDAIKALPSPLTLDVIKSTAERLDREWLAKDKVVYGTIMGTLSRRVFKEISDERHRQTEKDRRYTGVPLPEETRWLFDKTIEVVQHCYPNKEDSIDSRSAAGSLHRAGGLAYDYVRLCSKEPDWSQRRERVARSLIGLCERVEKVWDPSAVNFWEVAVVDKESPTGFTTISTWVPEINRWHKWQSGVNDLRTTVQETTSSFIVNAYGDSAESLAALSKLLTETTTIAPLKERILKETEQKTQHLNSLKTD